MTNIYIALIHKDPASIYGITVPDCPGCTAAEETLEGVLISGTEALRLWAEAEDNARRAVPAPRSFDDIMSDAEVAGEIAQGAVPVALPMLADKGRSKRINLLVDAGLVEAIDNAAAARGLTRTAFMVSAARDKITGVQ